MKPLFLLAIATFFIGTFVLAGQIGQFPPGTNPPGTYPPGTNAPGQNPRFPGGGNSRGSGKNSDTRQSASQPSETYRGVVRKLDASSMDLEIEDTRFLIIDFSNANPKPSDLRVGDGLDVVATADKEGNFHASSIQSDKDIAQTINDRDGIAQQQEGRTGSPPTILVRPDSSPANDGDDSGPPVLKHGKPATRASAPIPDDDAPNTPSSRTNTVAAPARPAANPHLALIEKAREVASRFLEGLPNYVVQESATRYVSETRQPSWNVVDVVSAEVVFEERRESYRNLQINGKPSKKPPEESGAWSTGEFGTILGNLFSPYTDADFKFAQDDTIIHRSASVFDFKVLRVRASWRIWTTGQYIMPAYRGSVWIDKQTGEVLRIEMQAKEIPEAFPEITVETAVDYDSIRLGTPEQFLLPVHSEALSCWRGSNDCQRNVIEFRNYHKFTGESNIEFK
jgi:predicted transcriptional regulator